MYVRPTRLGAGSLATFRFEFSFSLTDDRTTLIMIKKKNPWETTSVSYSLGGALIRHDKVVGDPGVIECTYLRALGPRASTVFFFPLPSRK